MKYFEFLKFQILKNYFNDFQTQQQDQYWSNDEKMCVF